MSFLSVPIRDSIQHECFIIKAVNIWQKREVDVQYIPWGLCSRSVEGR